MIIVRIIGFEHSMYIYTSESPRFGIRSTNYNNLNI